MRLSDLKTGQSATILKVLGHGGFRRRIMEMGFVRGKKVEVVLNAPLRDPIVYKIMDYEVSLRRSDEGRFAAVEVSDTGIGVTEADREHIFERFYQGSNPSFESIRGTGIGLMLAKDFVELHGGTLTLHWENEWFTVRILLPQK